MSSPSLTHPFLRFTLVRTKAVQDPCLAYLFRQRGCSEIISFQVPQKPQTMVVVPFDRPQPINAQNHCFYPIWPTSANKSPKPLLLSHLTNLSQNNQWLKWRFPSWSQTRKNHCTHFTSHFCTQTQGSPAGVRTRSCDKHHSVATNWTTLSRGLSFGSGRPDRRGRSSGGSSAGIGGGLFSRRRRGGGAAASGSSWPGAADGEADNQGGGGRGKTCDLLLTVRSRSGIACFNLPKPFVPCTVLLVLHKGASSLTLG